MMSALSGSADYIDSRDVLAVFEPLEDRDFDPDDPPELFPDDPLDDDEREEMESLRELLSAMESASADSARDGIIAYNEKYFEEYAKEFASDIGAISDDAGWPASFIDWEAAANALKQDYSEFEWDGATWLTR